MTRWLESSGGDATARLEWADGSGVIQSLTGVSTVNGTLSAGQYRLVLDVLAEAFATDFSLDSEAADLVASFTASGPTACSEADVTTTGAGEGDPGFGVPDGEVTARHPVLRERVVRPGPGDCGRDDDGGGRGDPGFGVPDGVVTAADIQYYVNIWFLGC